MAIKIDDIQRPISNEMEEFEQKFQASMKSNVFLLDKIMNYIVKRKGKQVRPMFVFLTAKMCGGITESSFTGASLIELLHTATLVHDDVVDNSNYRRGFFSLNALWKNKISVLVGDFLLSRGLLLAIDKEEFELLKLVSNAVQRMSEGEILQMEKARNLDITEEVYFDIIIAKTASLISSCCAVGASSSKTDKETIEKCRKFGELIGVAFQIKDDLFDYGNDEIGKPVGIDIKEKKMTLPLIYALNQSSWLEKKKIIFTIRNDSENEKAVAQVIKFVKDKGGMQYATKVMLDYQNQALNILNDFPDSPAKTSLIQLVQYTIERTK